MNKNSKLAKKYFAFKKEQDKKLKEFHKAEEKKNKMIKEQPKEMFGGLAQLVEHLTFNQGVGSSNLLSLI